MTRTAKYILLIFSSFVLLMPNSFGQRDKKVDVLFRDLAKCNSSIDSLHVLLEISDILYDSDPVYCLEVTDFTQNLALRIGDTKSLIESSNHLANIQKELGFIHLALKTIEENIERANTRGDQSLIGETRLNSGHIRLKLEDFNEAKSEYDKALASYTAVGDSSGMAYAYEGIGRVYSAKKQDNQALKYYEKAESSWPRDDHRGKARLWTDMGISYTTLGKYDDAQKFLNRSLLYYQKQGEFAGQVRVDYNRGMLFMKMNENFDAEAAFINCVDIGKRRRRPEDMMLGYQGLYDLNKGQGKYQQALIYHEKLVELERQQSKDGGQIIEGLEKFYQEEANLASQERQENFYAQKFRTKNQQNIILWIAIFIIGILLAGSIFFFLKIRKKNRILQQQKRDIESKNDEIDVSLREKDLLLKEVHHRVKNNLQIISSLLNLQRHKVRDEATLEVLGESINRIQSISLIHQKFYQSSNLAKVDFKNYLTDLVESQKRLYGNPDKPVRTSVIGKTQYLGLDTAVPLGLIIAELITNSFKHAFELEPHPELTVRIETDDYLTLTVRDNGKGLPPGFSIKNSNSLGMEIVEALSEQLYGSVSYRNDDGAVFVVKVKELQSYNN